MTTTDILLAAAEAFNVSPNKIRNKRRFQDPAMMARHAIAHAATMYTTDTLDRIGSVLNRHHSTVIHSRDMAGYMLGTEPEFEAKYNAMLRILGNPEPPDKSVVDPSQVIALYSNGYSMRTVSRLLGAPIAAVRECIDYAGIARTPQETMLMMRAA